MERGSLINTFTIRYLTALAFAKSSHFYYSHDLNTIESEFKLFLYDNQVIQVCKKVHLKHITVNHLATSKFYTFK